MDTISWSRGRLHKKSCTFLRRSWSRKVAIDVNTFLRPHLKNWCWKPFSGILVLLYFLLSMMILIIWFTLLYYTIIWFTLLYFHPNKETILKLKGLGSNRTQDRKPFAFAIKALADVEARCANIEREFFAIVYGCETFYTYLYGRSFTVNTEPHHSFPTRQRNWSS